MSQSPAAGEEKVWVLCKICGQPVKANPEQTPNLAWLRYIHCGGWHLAEAKDAMTCLEAFDKLIASGGLPEGDHDG